MTTDKSIRGLWSAVILAAVEDYKKGNSTAIRFVNSNDLDVVADIIEIHPDKIRAKLAEQAV